MALIQVGIIAARTPDGKFLPAVPIMQESSPVTEQATGLTETELARLFATRFKAYKDAGKVVKK